MYDGLESNKADGIVKTVTVCFLLSLLIIAKVRSHEVSTGMVFNGWFLQRS